jgi:hypothetical protein
MRTPDLIPISPRPLHAAFDPEAVLCDLEATIEERLEKRRRGSRSGHIQAVWPRTAGKNSGALLKWLRKLKITRQIEAI